MNSVVPDKRCAKAIVQDLLRALGCDSKRSRSPVRVKPYYGGRLTQRNLREPRLWDEGDVSAYRAKQTVSAQSKNARSPLKAYSLLGLHRISGPAQSVSLTRL